MAGTNDHTSAMAPGIPIATDSSSPSPNDGDNPVLSQYDPYHKTTYYMQHPFSEPAMMQPLRPGLDTQTSDTYEMPPPLWDAACSLGLLQPKLDYQDFAAEIQGLSNGNPHSTDTIQ